MEKTAVKDLSFEEAMTELEQIVRELEGGRIKLDDAVTAYERGVELKKHCEEKLKEAQTKIEKLEINPQGELSATPLDVEN